MTGSLGRASRRAGGGLALAVRAPSDGWLVARMLVWRASLPVLKYLLPLPRLVQLMDARPARGPRRPDRERRVATLADLVFDAGRSDGACLELSLVTYRYLAAAGARPRLVIAIRNHGQPARGHAWVTVEGVPVHDSPSALHDFASVITFESGDRAQPSEAARDAQG